MKSPVRLRALRSGETSPKLHERRRAAAIALAAAALGLAVPFTAQTPNPFNETLLRPFTYRNLGPFRMGARTSDIAVPAAPAKEHLYTFYVGFWTGGLWKTSNNGTTFEPVFDEQPKLAIGDVAVAPSDANVVWVGTGDAFTSQTTLTERARIEISSSHRWPSVRAGFSPPIRRRARAKRCGSAGSNSANAPVAVNGDRRSS